METLKVLADSLRLQIVKLLILGPCTVKQIAAEVNLPPTKLYYHVKQLEDHGLIHVVDTRIVSGIIEKQYRAVAGGFRISKSLFSPEFPDGRENLNRMLTGIFEETRDDIQKSIQAGIVDLTDAERQNWLSPDSLALMRVMAHITRDDAHEFLRRLKVLLDEFGAAEPDPRLPACGLLMVFYPTISGITPAQDE
ncbi:MAG: ArsR family transcriptional regulator [Anaerolineae bacterium]|nr:ArsR family transcriptional regulator [Anaerolineae bacterium]